MTVQPLMNEKCVEAFATEMLAHMTGASVTLMTSVGFRTGLFDVLAELPPSTSETISEQARLQERYVREWLSAMVTAGIVTYDPDGATYHLPPEHAAVLIRAAGPDNLGTLAQMLSGVALVEDELVSCFRHGGGVPYSSFPRFQEVMSDAGDPSRSRAITALPTLAPGLVQKLEKGIEVLDAGCGRGFVSIEMARRYRNSRFVGYDFTPEALEYANERAKSFGLTNVRFEVHDQANHVEPERFGLITTFDAIHDQADPERVVSNIYSSLQPGGEYLMMEPAGSSHLHKNLDHPMATILYTISCFHCMTVSLSQGGKGLGTMWGEEVAIEMLANAGFHNIRIEQVEGDIESSYFFARKPY